MLNHSFNTKLPQSVKGLWEGGLGTHYGSGPFSHNLQVLLKMCPYGSVLAIVYTTNFRWHKTLGLSTLLSTLRFLSGSFRCSVFYQHALGPLMRIQLQEYTVFLSTTPQKMFSLSLFRGEFDSLRKLPLECWQFLSSTGGGGALCCDSKTRGHSMHFLATRERTGRL